MNLPAMFRRASEFVDMIAKGTNPAYLPIEQPVNFELVINQKTSEAIGVTISPTVLIRVNELIE